MNSTHQTEIPDQLWHEAQTLVQQGWAGNLQEIVTEALRSYLESNQQVLTETLIQEDIEWRLHGED